MYVNFIQEKIIYLLLFLANRYLNLAHVNPCRLKTCSTDSRLDNFDNQFYYSKVDKNMVVVVYPTKLASFS